MGTIRIYCLKRKIGGYWYGEKICASSLEDAKAIAEKIGAEVTGELVDSNRICKCGETNGKSADRIILDEREIDWIQDFEYDDL